MNNEEYNRYYSQINHDLNVIKNYNRNYILKVCRSDDDFFDCKIIYNINQIDKNIFTEYPYIRVEEIVSNPYYRLLGLFGGKSRKKKKSQKKYRR